MPAKRPDKAYIQARIRELYRNHTAEEIAHILTDDPNVASTVTLSSVLNDISRMRSQENLELKERIWSKEDQSFLKVAYELGADISAIAERLDRTVPAIHARISQCGLANRKITEYQEESVRLLLTTTDQSLAEIAFHLGIKYEAVRHVWERLNASGRVNNMRRTYPDFWKHGSIAERLLRASLTDLYRDAVVPESNNREWSGTRRYQIDIPIDFGDGRKFAIEVNHVRVHAYRRNIDFAKRRYAESLGWVWIPVWIHNPPTHAWIDDSARIVQQIVEERRLGRSDYYDAYMLDVAAMEQNYYAPDQPVYDPKEGVPFGEPWSLEDINTMMQHYVSTPIEELQRTLHTSRTRNAIIHKARCLGLRKDRGFYCSEEDAIILQNFASAPKHVILKKLPGRTWAGISGRARHLRIRRDGGKAPHHS